MTEYQIERNEELDPDSQNQTHLQINRERGHIELPYSSEEFEKFIASLLGKPQIIEKTIYGYFEIDLEMIQNFHYLLDQRIMRQNEARLVQFQSKIFYDDNSSVTLNGFEEFSTYTEVKPLISVGVELSWIYLIQFSDKNTPEKQEITLLIVGETDARMLQEGTNKGSRETVVESGYFRYNIRHTERTWGQDIDTLLSNHINLQLQQENLFKKFLFKHKEIITLVFSFVTFGILFIGW